MLKMIHKILVLCVVGAPFSTHTQSMNEDDDYKRTSNQGREYGNNYGVVTSPKEAGIFDAGSSACFRSIGGPEIQLPKSYRALQISYEYLLYEFCDHRLDEKGSRAREESRKNKEYFKACLATQKQRAFSVQPNSSLKNQLGYEIEAWLVKREEGYAAYRAASTELQKREALHQKSPSQRNEIRFRIAEQRYNAILSHFMRMHGPVEVMLGEKEATEGEIASIKQKIYSKKKTPIIITPSAFYSSALPVGTPYQKDLNVSKVQGFILEPQELPRAYKRLQILTKALTRECEILQDVSVYYHDTFLPKVKGWATWQIGNWMALSQIIATAQIDIKKLVESKYPFSTSSYIFARDRTTDQGDVLAYLNRDERGQELRVRLSKVNRSFTELNHQDAKMSRADHFFAKVYCGEDELEPGRGPEKSCIEAKYPHPNPISVQFEKVKTRKYIFDEERYKTRLMFDPISDDHNLLEENELALSLRGNQLSCWGKNKEEMTIDTLIAEQVKVFWSLKHILSQLTFPVDIFKWCVSLYCRSNNISVVLQKDVYKRLRENVQENKEPTPNNRRALLDFTLLRKYISPTQETWVMPKNAQMVEEYPSLSHVFAHKRKWGEVIGELKKKHNPIITDFCRTPSDLTNGYNIITSYEELYDGLSFPSLDQPTYESQDVVNYHLLYKEYETVLEKHIKLLREMHQSFGPYTSIPDAIKFFISETYAEEPPTLPLIPPQEIVLSNSSIRDDDLQKKRPTQSGYEYVLYCYLTVDLSHNFLTGFANYHFCQYITTLNLRGNHINSLKFLSYLSALKILDLSNNMVSDLSDFLNISRSIDQGCLSLQDLNLSDNEIEDVAPLFALKLLRNLDISGNKLKNLIGLYQTDKTTPSYDVVQRDGKPPIVQRGVSKQMDMSLLTSLKANKNVLEGNWKSVLPEGLNYLSILEIKDNANLKLPSKPHDFFEIFPTLKTLKTDMGDEYQMSKEPILIELRYRSLEDENIEIKDRVLKISGESENILEESHTLFYCMWLNLSHNKLIGSSLNFFSNCIVRLEISKNMLCHLAFIRGFPNLTYLDVSSNLIDDVSSLEACSSIKYVDISTNNVRSLKSLNGVTSLEILKASSNAFEGHWTVILPKGLINLETVEMDNNNAVIFNGWGELNTFFPALKFLNRGDSSFVRNNKEEVFKKVLHG